MTKEQFKKFAHDIIKQSNSQFDRQRTFMAELVEHDPVFAKLWEAGICAAEKQLNYLKTRLEK